jgi:hypothetical protein
MVGLHFFMANTMIEQKVKKFGALDLLSKIGGMYGSLYQILFLVGSYYNSRMLLGHLISKLYFIKYKEASDDCNKTHLRTVNFTKYDVFSHIKFKCCGLKNTLCNKLCR